MTGISLNFDENGKASVKEKALPLCMGWIPCEHLIERVSKKGKLEIHEPVCKILGKNVHEIFDQICTTKQNPCPLNIYYCSKEGWYYKKKDEK